MRLPRLARPLPYQPWSVLVPLVVLEWLGTLVEARRIPHNGWLWGRGRTETLHSTTAWLLAHDHIPHVVAGYGWAVVLAPFTWLTGPTSAGLLPYVIVAQVLFLVPAGAFAVYVLGARSAGALVGYLAATAWTLGPFVGGWYFDLKPGWQPNVLTQLLGLTTRPELPAAVVLAFAAVLVLRALDEGRRDDAALAGIAAGLAVTIVPANVAFLVAPVAALGVSRRWRLLGWFGVGLIPAAVGMAVWSEASVGHLSLLLPPTHYSWTLFVRNWQLMLYSAWSARLLHWVALAGVIALAKRSPVRAVLFGTWVAAYAAAVGANTGLRSDRMAFFHFFVGGLPALCVLVGALPLLWPRAQVTFARRDPYLPVRGAAARWSLPVLALISVAWIAAASPTKRALALSPPSTNGLVALRGPVAHAVASRRTVTVTWTPRLVRHVSTAYAIYRSRAGADVTCRTGGAAECDLTMQWVGTTRRTGWVDTGRRPGTFAYRIGVVAAVRGVGPHPLLLIGPRATARVR